MKELPKRALEFEENPKIEDMIKVLKQAQGMGYTRIKPFLVDGDYRHETMDLEKILRIYLF